MRKWRSVKVIKATKWRHDSDVQGGLSENALLRATQEVLMPTPEDPCPEDNSVLEHWKEFARIEDARARGIRGKFGWGDPPHSQTGDEQELEIRKNDKDD